MSSKPIDEKIVQLTLDADKFEQNAKNALKTFESMNKEIAGQTLDISNMTNAAEQIANRFTLMGNIVQEVYSRIATTVVNYGTNMLKSLTVDQVTAGWQKYNDVLTSTATIVSAIKDTQYGGDAEAALSATTDSLAKLNWYTDETSYNFSDMTSNIGKFTAVGVKLEDAQEAMEGITNWAAKSGQGVQQASMAMYNLAQAMGTGKLMTKDWMSIENANMATSEFKQTCIDVATELNDGVAPSFSEGAVTVGNFRDSLSEGWLTSDILQATLQEYGKFGTELGDILQGTGTQCADVMGTIDDMADGTITNSKEMSESLTKALGADGLQSLLEDTGLSVDELYSKFTDLASADFKLSREAFEMAQEYRTFNDVIDATADAVSTKIMNMFTLLIGNYEQAKQVWTWMGNDLYNFIADPLDNAYDIMEEVFDEADKLGARVMLWGDDDAKVLGAIPTIVDNIKNSVQLVLDVFSSFFSFLDADHLYSMIQGLYEFAHVTDILPNILQPVHDLLAPIASVAGKIVFNILSVAVHLIAEVVDVISTLVGWLSSLFTGLLGVAQYEDIWYTIGDGVDLVGEKLNEAITIVHNFVENFIQPIDEAVTGVTTLLSTIGSAIYNYIGKTFTRFLNGTITLKDAIGDIVDYVSGKIQIFVSIINHQFPKIKLVLAPVVAIFYALKTAGEILIGVVKGILDAFGLWDTIESIIDAVKGTFEALVDYIQSNDVLNSIITVFSEMFSRIQKYISGFDGIDPMEMLQSIFENVPGIIAEELAKLSGVFEGISDIVHEHLIDPLIKTLKGFGIWKPIQQYILSPLSKIKDFLVDTFSDIEGTIEGIKNWFTSAVEYFKNFNLGTFVQDVKTWIDNLVTSIEDFFNITQENRWKITAGVGMMGFILVAYALIKNFITKIQNLKKAFGALWDGIKELAKTGSFGDLFEGMFGLTNFGKGVKNMGIASVMAAVLPLAEGLEKLAEIPVGKLSKGAATIITIVGLLAIIEGLLSKLGGKGLDSLGDMAGIAVVIAAFGFAAIEIAAALKIFSTIGMSTDQIAEICNVIKWVVVLAAIVAAAMVALEYIKVNKEVNEGLNQAGKALNQFATGFKWAAIAAAVVSMVACVAVLMLLVSQKEGLKKALEAIGIIALILIELVAASVFAQYFGDGKNFKRLATACLELVAAVVILTVLTSLAGFNSVFLAIVEVGAIIEILVEIANQAKQMKDGAKNLIYLSTSALLIVAAIGILSMLLTLNWVGVAAAVVVLGLIIFGLMQACAWLDGMNTEGVVGLVSLAASVLILAAALAVLDLLDFTTTLMNCIILGLIITALVVATKMLNGVQGVSGAMSMIIMAAAVAILAAALTVLSLIDPEGIANSILLLGTSLLIIVAVLYLAGQAAQNTVVGLLALSLLFVTVAALCVAFGIAVKLVSEGLTQLSEANSEGLRNNLITVLAALASLVVIGPLAGTGIAVLSLALLVFAAAILAVGAAFYVFGGGAQVAAAGIQALSDALAPIISMVSGVVSTIVSGISTVISWVASGISTVANLFTQGGSWIMQGLSSGIVGTIGTAISSVTSVCSGIWDTFCSLFDAHSPSRLLEQLGQWITQGLGIGIEEDTSAEDAAESKGESTYDSLMSSFSSDDMSSLISGDMSSALSNLNIDTSVIDTSSMNSFFEQAGISGSDSMLTGISEGMSSDTITSSLSSVSSNVSIDLTQTGVESAQSFTAGFEKGITSNMTEVEASGKNMGTKALGALESTAGQSKTYTSGAYFGIGFENGITSRISTIKQAGSQAGTAAYNALKAAINQGSPSKYTTESGEFFGQGFFNGISSTIESVAAVATRLGSTAVNALNGSLNTSPTITPVIDMDSFDSYQVLADNMEMSVKGMADVEGRFTPMVDSLNDMQEKVLESNNNVLTELKSMKEIIDNIYNKPYPDGDTYLDGKKITKTIAPEMNKQLAILAKRGK